MKITVITWKDERWSADKEALAGLNKLLKENAKITSRVTFWKILKQWMIIRAINIYCAKNGYRRSAWRPPGGL